MAFAKAVSDIPTGKGMFVWAIRDCQPNGDPQDIADRLAGAGIRHVAVKIANGQNVPGVSYQTESQTRALCARLKERNIQVWGWQYVLGESPAAEALTAARIVKAWGLDGFASDMEGEFDTTTAAYDPQTAAAKASRAYTYALTLRNYLPAVPLALTSYRYPSVHPYFPWQIRRYFDLDMPQVYWEGSTNPGYQVRRSYSEFRKMPPLLPFAPIGSAYKRGAWQATPAQIVEFLDAARGLPGVIGASFWELGRIDKYIPDLWPVIASYNWPVAAPPQPQPPPQEITVSTTKSEYFRYDLILHDGLNLTGSNVNGTLIDVPGVPKEARVIKARIVAVSDDEVPRSWVALGTGSDGTSRHKLVGRPVVRSKDLKDPYDDGNNGTVLLPAPNKVYLQWFVPEGKTLKYWIYLQGYEI